MQIKLLLNYWSNRHQSFFLIYIPSFLPPSSLRFFPSFPHFFLSLFLQYVFLLASLVRIFGGKPSSSLPELSFKNFKKVPGNSLMGNETATLEVDDSLDCSFACVEDLECLSFNFGTSSSMERQRKICELSNSIKAWDPQNFKRRPGFDFYGMVSLIPFPLLVQRFP